MPATKTTAKASQALRLLLECERSTDEAVAGIVANPALHAEAKELFPALKAQAAPAGDDGIAKVIMSRFATFPQPQRSVDEWRTWWLDYYEALSGVPLDALEAGMKAWVARADAEFMPKPGKLREMASLAGSTAIIAYTRAKLAAAQEPKTFKPEEVAERKRQVAELREVFKPKVVLDGGAS